MKPTRKLVLGHRGYPPRAVENTLASARMALEAGADGLEFDVQKARDAYVVFHDDTLARLGGRPERIADVDASVWRHLPVAIPELGEWLRGLPRTILNLELKEETLTPDDADAIDALVQQNFDPAQVLISSFEHNLLPPWRARGYRTGLLFDERHLNQGIGGVVGPILRHRPWSLNLPVEFFERSGLVGTTFASLVRFFGVKILVWTVNTDAQMALVWRHCDGVITNETHRALEFRARAEASGQPVEPKQR